MITTTITPLSEDHDPVDIEDAAFVVETDRDETGKVVAERWCCPRLRVSTGASLSEGSEEVASDSEPSPQD